MESGRRAGLEGGGLVIWNWRGSQPSPTGVLDTQEPTSAGSAPGRRRRSCLWAGVWRTAPVLHKASGGGGREPPPWLQILKSSCPVGEAESGGTRRSGEWGWRDP